MTTDDYTRPHPKSSALLTIDVQADFTYADGTATIEGTAEVLPSVAHVVAAYRRAGRPVVHVIRLYQCDGTNVDLCRRALVESGARIVAPGTAGSQLAREILTAPFEPDPSMLLQGRMQQVGPNEHVLYKPRWGAFFDTRLQEFLDDADIDTLVITGCNFPNCPRATAYQASERDYRIVALRDAISGVYTRGLDELRGIGVHVTTAGRWSDQIVDSTSPRSERSMSP